jgi:hypothetical protein
MVNPLKIVVEVHAPQNVAVVALVQLQQTVFQEYAQETSAKHQPVQTLC